VPTSTFLEVSDAVFWVTRPKFVEEMKAFCSMTPTILPEDRESVSSGPSSLSGGQVGSYVSATLDYSGGQEGCLFRYTLEYSGEESGRFLSDIL
jgi:hypothetical protein